MSPVNHCKRNTKKGKEYRDYPSLKPHTEKILIIVKTAPHPSVYYKETVCTVGVTEKGKLIRLFPIDYRYMSFFKRFKKYQWVSLEIEKHKRDKRIDSYRPNLKTLKILTKPLPAGKWTERKKIILPLVSPSLETIKRIHRKENISLGIFKPKKITDFLIEPDVGDWSNKHKQVLSQLYLFGQQPKELEKIPYKFSYRFICNIPKCKGHKIQIFDWEIYQLYRNIKSNYPYSMDVVLEKIKQKWLDMICSPKRDTHFIVGTRYPFPTFIILGVFWPPK